MITRWICTVGAVLVFAAPCLAQTPLDGKMELSVGGSFQAISFDENDGSSGVLNVPVRVGYFVTEGLELEGEAIVSVWEEDVFYDNETYAVFVISANVAYNFPTGSSIRPFLLGGIGLTDGAWPPLGNAVLFEDLDESTRTVFNLGVGMKAMVGNRAALRVEYRMQSFSEVEDEGYTYSGITSHTVQVGASLFVL